MLADHEIYMSRCIELASNGLGSTAPNPMVGAVVVHAGMIIGEGWHRACGGPHAEVHAVERVRDRTLLKDSTLYVSLEPCNHQGRTPPCTDLILQSGIPRVVIGQADPNPIVAGGGSRRLTDSGVEVITGVLEKECRFLNRRFNTFHLKKRPYIILKWAQTSDGFVDAERDPASGIKPAWITDEACRRLVHKWRTEEQAILAGSRTILLDNPQLNVRAWSGRNPIRITIDRTGKLFRDGGQRTADSGIKDLNSPEASLNILDQSVPTLIFTERDHRSEPNLEFIQVNPGQEVWPQVLKELYQREIQSVIVEGGPTLLRTLIDQGLWDEARVFIGPGWFGQGIRAPQLPARPVERAKVGNSVLVVFTSDQ
ncbi:MAG: bifunctional diaminohydroxyphosphoribosylaminopyrimidine deaminase/5-amino-6-(5-phosphoribosylamino)uracil reductase RibD [Bacteroidales bacterium]